LLVVFEILDGEHRGRRIFQNITLQNSSQQAVEIGRRLLKDLFEGVGHTGPTRDIRIMLSKPVMVRVGIKRDKDGIYADRDIVTSVRPPDHQPKRRGPGSASPPGESAAPTASGGTAPWRS
jgi:Protein of unknown function (DUF669)